MPKVITRNSREHLPQNEFNVSTDPMNRLANYPQRNCAFWSTLSTCTCLLATYQPIETSPYPFGIDVRRNDRIRMLIIPRAGPRVLDFKDQVNTGYDRTTRRGQSHGRQRIVGPKRLHLSTASETSTEVTLPPGGRRFRRNFPRETNATGAERVC